ncbi:MULTISPECIES: phosphotransferase [unclassified Isoptericola]|uniref:phosphotransferase n=1 Tax=unclassified Isoptericola TaxID=2623355 RepID=UPI00366395B9
MAGAFSTTVTSAAWRSEVAAWTEDALARRGVRVLVPADQTRVRPWSTQLVLETDAGRAWFKAGCRAAAHEPALQRLLAEIAPDQVDAPLAVEAARGWMLTADRGATLRERRDPSTADWAAVLVRFARLQQDVAERRDELLATGLPDCSPGTLPGRFDAVLDHLRTLPPGHPVRLDETTAAALDRARPAVRAAADLLAAGPLPATLQHGDLHPGNVFETGGALRVFDLGDAQWAHPLEVLEVSSAVARDAGVAWAPVEAAYRSSWEAWLAARGLPGFDDGATGGEGAGWDGLRRAAGTVHAVNRAWAWCGALAEATDAEWADWGEAPGRHLSGVLRRQA